MTWDHDLGIGSPAGIVHVAEYERPRYDDKATVLVRVSPTNSTVYAWEYEVLDHTGGCAEIIHEGVGWDWFFDHWVGFGSAGVYVVTDIEGEYVQGDRSWGEDDDEWWNWAAIRPATLRERVLERLEAANAYWRRTQTLNRLEDGS